MQKLHLLTINAGDEVISNISGGTKIMSLALYAFAHAINQAENVCYFDTNQNLQWLNKKTKDSVTTKIFLEEYIELQGQKITSKVELKDALVKFKDDVTFLKKSQFR